jgi:HEAT repeat protein
MSMQKALKCSAVLVVLVTAAVSLAADPLPADDSRVQALAAQDAAPRMNASQELIEVGAPAVRALLETMDRDNRTAGKMAWETLFRIVQKSADTPRQSEVSAVLAGEFAGQHTISTRRAIARLLSFVADDAALVALYPALGDPELRDLALLAIARTPGQGATMAMIGALQISEPPFVISLINALGERGDPRAAAPLAGGAINGKGDVRLASMHALSRIPSPVGIDPIRRAVEEKLEGASSAMLTLAGTLLDAGMDEQAGRALSLAFFVVKPEPSVTEICRHIHGWSRLGGEKGLLVVLEGLDHASPRVRGCAAQACARLPGETATAAIAARMLKANGELKMGLLRALGRRGEWMDDQSAMLLVQTAESGDPVVRVAAIQAIEAAGVHAALPVLLEAMEDPASEVRNAAEHALNRMAGKEMTRGISDALPAAAPNMQPLLARALGRRGDTSVLPVLLKLASSASEPEVRAAAYTAMGDLRDPGALDGLLKGFEATDESVRRAAEKAVLKIEGDEATRRLLDAYQQAPAAQKPSLLRVIAQRRTPEVPALLASESKSESLDIRAAAIEGLGYQDDPRVGPMLLEVARGGPELITRAAVDAYLKAAQRAEGGDRAAAGRMFVEALEHAVTDEQRRQALVGINRHVDPTATHVLEGIAPLVREGGVQAEAATTAVKFAVNLPSQQRELAVELLTRAARMGTGAGIRRRAAEHLRQLGVDVNPAREAGFVTHWWIVGPFPNLRDEMWDRAYQPEERVDLDMPVKAGGDALHWKPFRTTDPEGIVDLERAVASRPEVGAYAYAEIIVPAEQDVQLQIGSDDSIVVWVNGDRVHANRTGRGLAVDQDQAEARLKAGTNRVLVKVLNNVHAWAFCLRVTTPGGEPLAFEQRAE